MPLCKSTIVVGESDFIMRSSFIYTYLGNEIKKLPFGLLQFLVILNLVQNHELMCLILTLPITIEMVKEKGLLLITTCNHQESMQTKVPGSQIQP